MKLGSFPFRRHALRCAALCCVAAGLVSGCTDQSRSPLATAGDASFAQAPNNLIIVNGNNQIGVAGDSLVKPITVEVRYNGYPVPNVTVYWSVTSGGGSLRHASSVGNSVGRASNRWTLGASGTQRVKAEVPGAGSVTFDARVLPAGSTLRLVSGNNQKGLMTTGPLLHPLVVELVDGSGNPLP
ncbi:MAG TPA: hypothetical protein VFR37_15310, partial [Longimicrobium sp.]|nr:hypothetical protein [Longimicrobium sp.]